MPSIGVVNVGCGAPPPARRRRGESCRVWSFSLLLDSRGEGRRGPPEPYLMLGRSGADVDILGFTDHDYAQC